MDGFHSSKRIRLHDIIIVVNAHQHAVKNSKLRANRLTLLHTTTACRTPGSGSFRTPPTPTTTACSAISSTLLFLITGHLTALVWNEFFWSLLFPVAFLVYERFLSAIYHTEIGIVVNVRVLQYEGPGFESGWIEQLSNTRVRGSNHGTFFSFPLVLHVGKKKILKPSSRIFFLLLRKSPWGCFCMRHNTVILIILNLKGVRIHFYHLTCIISLFTAIF